ncbi:uncharacterized protein BO95DRAFT_517398 [Aspergillus brunneoviolaceus CBS 621.78]|uniref:Uncharacterized protein n=1 Tax=Aspergillus brunneoviolaceus CBS 621.78 TaxID=1450534 RepID=A0ACD1FYU4_9EURO|nr:hypothetical protein BO95DRAFT_517398 [Aspergillus brunneoviolaceus CBS 621.78]RAH42156.1 hypothetical protein BO95DRAFT_517398 [Aspergillus brunneoviolaceus CBS 621.78]
MTWQAQLQSYHFSGTNYGLEIGQNSGSVSAQFHLPPERPETPPSPLSTVPFLRNPDYVDCGSLVDKLDAICAVPASRTAILAIEYSYRVRKRSPETWVLWIHASNTVRLELSYRELADRLKIYGRHHPQANIFELISSWLNDARHGRWILVLDNLDDEHMLFKPLQPRGSLADAAAAATATAKDVGAARPLIALLPTCPNGAIIVTTRNRNVAINLGYERNILTINPMDETSGLALLRKKLPIGDEGSLSEARLLLRALEFIPLAIMQAIAVIRSRDPRGSVLQYREELGRNLRLLDHEAHEAHAQRDYEANNSILGTWKISFEYIRRARWSAARLLAVMSFYNHQGIPECLLRGFDDDDDDDGFHQATTDETWDCRLTGVPDDENDDGADGESGDEAADGGTKKNDDFEADIRILRDFSFLSVTHDKHMFQSHRLVQRAIKRWLEAREPEMGSQRIALRSLDRNFPFSDYVNVESCRLLFPHLRKAIRARPSTPEATAAWLSLLVKGAGYAFTVGNWKEAGRMGSMLRLWGAQNLGEPGNIATTFMGGLYQAWAECMRHRLPVAERLLARSVKIAKESLGEDHPQTWETMLELADMYSWAGRFLEAQALRVEVAHRDGAVDSGHSNELALSATNGDSQHGESSRMEQMLSSVLRATKQMMGLEHPLAFHHSLNLVDIYMSQHRWQDAERVLAPLAQSHQDPESFLMLLSITNLASVYEHQKRWPAAEACYLRALAGIRTTLDRGHRLHQHLQRALANLYLRQGQIQKAELHLLCLIDLQHRAPAEHDPDLLATLHSLVCVYKSQKRWEDARQTMSKITQMAAGLDGGNHQDTIGARAVLSRHDTAIQEPKEEQRALVESHPNRSPSSLDAAIGLFLGGGAVWLSLLAGKGPGHRP